MSGKSRFCSLDRFRLARVARHGELEAILRLLGVGQRRLRRKGTSAPKVSIGKSTIAAAAGGCSPRAKRRQREPVFGCGDVGQRPQRSCRTFGSDSSRKSTCDTMVFLHPRTQCISLSARIAKPAMPRFDDGLDRAAQVCPKSAPPASVTDRPSAHVKDGVVRTC